MGISPYGHPVPRPFLGSGKQVSFKELELDYNFIRSSKEETDKELFFAPIEIDDSFFRIEEGMSMAHVLVKAGVFPSVSQARNNGWNKPIPKGFIDFRAGKLKTRVTILNEILG